MLRRLLLAYLAVLLLSHLVTWLRGPVPPEIKEDYTTVEVPRREGPLVKPGKMRLGYRELPAARPEAPVIVLLHGSPGDGDTFQTLAAELGPEYRVLVPDLPGFGSSERVLHDYSIETHAGALLDWLDELEIDQVHLVGFSMGGGVALEMAEAQPARIRSLTLLASIGVQELELFGKYELNHAVHGLQILGTRLAAWLLPHFGALREGNGLRNYARNFYDTDQRPLRDILLSWHGPAQIIHGERDILVPIAAAHEHARLLPQARVEIWSGEGHLLPWGDSRERVVTAITDFVDEVEAGRALGRAAVDEAARQRALEPWNPADAPRLAGFALLIMLALLAGATLVSEDLTCISTGLLIAQGRIGFLAGTSACFVGILIGDGLLFLLGRWLGLPALSRAPLRWLVRPRAVYRASSWFEHRGGKVILLSRFLPGLRLPTYVAAGMLGQRPRTFLFYFAIAGLLWTPTLVGVSTWAGKEVLEALRAVEGYAVPVLVLLAFGLLFAQKLIVPLFTRRGRRLLWAAWRRKREWEFWPPQVFYLPILVQVVWLALRSGGLRVVTAVNPGIPTGGLVGESKWQILRGLGCDPEAPGGARGPAADALPASLLLTGTGDRVGQAEEFLRRHELSYPVILKPDRGERGRGVEVIRSRAQLSHRLAIDPTDLLLQEFVRGEEFGVFYIREPGSAQGELLSINGKRLLQLAGDGERTLEQLILDDPRAVKQAEVHFEYHALQLYDTPAAGEVIDLVEVGAHARGTLFLDRRDLRSDALRARLDEIADAFPGFHFGRFDLRVPSAEALRSGEGLRILELNGMTAEVTHIYQPGYRLLTAWRDIGHQWSTAFRIARANLRDGARVSSWAEVFGAWAQSRREHRTREQALLSAEIAAEAAEREKRVGQENTAPSLG